MPDAQCLMPFIIDQAKIQTTDKQGLSPPPSLALRRARKPQGPSTYAKTSLTVQQNKLAARSPKLAAKKDSSIL
jgi:hypothetical protein